MATPLNISFLVFNGMQVLDVTGPASVFAAANDAAAKVVYKINVLSAVGGAIQSSSGIVVATQSLKKVPPRSVDTLLVAGGDASGIEALASDKTVRKWVLQVGTHARRIGSICTGAFALGHFDLLHDKRVATHWSVCAALAERYPTAHVDANALYVEDGRLWTSAGVTTGIDMSLAMVERDLGSDIANAVAKRLVLYARRPGYQSQFSPLLSAQTHADAPFADLVEWMKANLAGILDVPALAARVAMSERSFHRKFSSCFGQTPAHFVETLRLDQVRTLLEARMSLKEIASKTGFANATQLSKAFHRQFGMTPLLFREVHIGLSAG